MQSEPRCLCMREVDEFFQGQSLSPCWSTCPEHRRSVWESCFGSSHPWSCQRSSSSSTESAASDKDLRSARLLDAQRDAERLAACMLGINPPCICGDVQDWERGDESDTMVHNMVSTSVVSGSEVPINLSQLAMLLPFSTYDRKRFAAITIRIANPRCTALLFTSGKLVITGVKSWYECLLASLCIGRTISRLFVHAKYNIINCEVQNIVAHSEIKLRENQVLNIQQMYENMAMECTYQRNMFPGLIYRGKVRTPPNLMPRNAACMLVRG